MRKSGAEIVVDALIQEGIDVLFGYPGGVIIPIFDALYDHEDKIKVVLNRHEQGCALAAAGYARATGKTGVCLATSGPGATNIVTGIADAYLDSTPMVALSGQVTSSLIGTDAFQEADMVGITRPITKHNFLVTKVEELAETLKKAFHIASTGRPGPVLVDIPKDVSLGMMDNYSYPKSVSIRSYKPNLVGHPKQIEKAADAIKNAKKPYCYAGGGIIHAEASEELKAFVDKTKMPITTTLMGLGAYPATGEYFLGMPGMHGTKAANFAFQECDLIVCVGARFDDRVTGKVSAFAPHAKIIHIDVDPSVISKIVKADIPVVGDAKNILRELTDLVEPGDYTDWVKQTMEWRGPELFRFKDSDEVIKSQAVIKTLWEETEGKCVVTTEVGQHQMWAAHYYPVDRPRQWFTSGGLGTMGFGMPAAMGASLALGREPVIDIAGDGSIQMNIQELATIALHNIPVKVVILNNKYLGMVRQWQEMFFKGRYSAVNLDTHQTSLDSSYQSKDAYIPDFVKLSESYTIPAFRATKPSEVRDVIRKGMAIDGPAVMEFMVVKEDNVFPMVPAGASLSDVVEEDFDE